MQMFSPELTVSLSLYLHKSCFLVLSYSLHPHPLTRTPQPNKLSQSRGRFRRARKFPSNPNRWLQLCPWLMQQLPCRPRQSSSSPFRPPCCLWSNQLQSASNQHPLQVRAHSATHRGTLAHITLYCRPVHKICWQSVCCFVVFHRSFLCRDNMVLVMLVISEWSCSCFDNE